MRVAYLGPAGTVSHEALTRPAPDGVEGVPLPTLRDGGARGAATAASSARWCRSRTRSRAAVDPALDALALEADDVSIVGELVQPVLLLPGRRRRARARRRHDGASRTRRRLGQCARFLRRALPRRRGRAAPPRPPTRCARWRRRRPSHARGDRHRGSPARRYGCGDAAPRTSRTTRATRRGSSGSPAPARAPPRPATGPARPRWCSGAPARLGPGWLVRCLAVFAFARREPHADRVRPLRRGIGRVHVLPRPRGRDGRRRGRRRGRRICARTPSGACPRLVSGAR